jgi:uroporphyrinogen-III decarboxylase
MERSWKDHDPYEKRERRFERWLKAEGVAFRDGDAMKAYRKRIERFIKAFKLEEPDRVPVLLPVGLSFPAFYSGRTLKDVMYDYAELKRVWLRFLQDFEMDTFMGPGLVLPGRVLEMIDYRIHLWPGHGLADDVPSYQYVEGEYMFADEYDDLIRDPADFLFRTYIPRICGALQGLNGLPPLTPFVGIPIFFISHFADPDVKRSIVRLLEAAEETRRWQNVVAEVVEIARSNGIPTLSAGFSGAPFDLLGDMMRGTKGILMDMYKRPEKLIEAAERLVPILVDEAARLADISGCPVIFMPLHKGEDSFMSPKQFETFYWPTLRKVLLGLVEEGLVPIPFAEGSYTRRLEVIKDLPPRTVVWWFEATDMKKAKEVLGGVSCIAGNVPVSLLCTGTPEEVKRCCKELIETCGKGGGYILAGSASMDRGNPENLRAMMEAAKEYGTYGRG